MDSSEEKELNDKMEHIRQHGISGPELVQMAKKTPKFYEALMKKIEEDPTLMRRLKYNVSFRNRPRPTPYTS